MYLLFYFCLFVLNLFIILRVLTLLGFCNFVDHKYLSLSDISKKQKVYQKNKTNIKKTKDISKKQKIYQKNKMNLRNHLFPTDKLSHCYLNEYIKKTK